MNAREKAIQEKAYAARLQKLNTKEIQARSNHHLVLKVKSRNHKGKLTKFGGNSLNSSFSDSQFVVKQLESQPDYDIYDKFLPKIDSYKPVGVSLLSVNMCKQQDPWAKLIHNKLFSEENKDEVVRYNQKLAEAEYSRTLALQIEEKKKLQQQAYRQYSDNDDTIKPLLADNSDRNPRELKALETQVAEFAMHVTEEKRLLREAIKAREKELAKQMEKEALRSAEIKAEREKKYRAERTKYADELLQRQKEAVEKRRKEKEITVAYDRKCLEEMEAKMRGDEVRRAGETMLHRRSIRTTPLTTMDKFQQPLKEREKFIETLINSESSLNGLYAHSDDNSTVSVSRSSSRQFNNTAPPTSQWEEMKREKVRKKEQEAKKIEEERAFLHAKMMEKLAEDRAREIAKKETAKNYQQCLDQQRQEMNFISLRSLKDGMSSEEKQLNAKLLLLGK